MMSKNVKIDDDVGWDAMVPISPACVCPWWKKRSEFFSFFVPCIDLQADDIQTDIDDDGLCV